jgi:hypothetical protein
MLFVAQRGVIKGILLSNLKLVRARRVGRGGGLVVVSWVLAGSDLSRDLCEGLKSSPSLTCDWELDRGSAHLSSTIGVISSIAREAIQLQQSLLSIVNADTRALLHEVRRQAVDTTLGELFATSLAGMLIAVARIVQLGTSIEVLEDECCREVTRVSRLSWSERGGGWDEGLLCRRVEGIDLGIRPI